jgi:microcystin degradation protein MlrC
MAERALHATDVLARTLAGHINPTMAWCSLPILWSARKMLDTENPFRRVVARLEEMAPGLLTKDFPSAAANIGINPADDGVAGVLSASVGLGYQHCNSPVNGACTIVVTDSDLELAQKLSNKLGSWIWEQRTEWIFEEPTAVEALRAGEARGEYPIVIADQGDNTGGGAPGDATHILRLFVERNLERCAVMYVVDPESASLAAQTGIGGTVSLQIGGKSHERLGPPVCMRVEVLAVTVSLCSVGVSESCPLLKF